MWGYLSEFQEFSDSKEETKKQKYEVVLSLNNIKGAPCSVIILYDRRNFGHPVWKRTLSSGESFILPNKHLQFLLKYSLWWRHILYVNQGIVPLIYTFILHASCYQSINCYNARRLRGDGQGLCAHEFQEKNLRSDWPQLLQKKLNLSQHKEDQVVVFVLDKQLYQLGGSAHCVNVFPWADEKSVNVFLSQPDQNIGTMYVALSYIEYKSWPYERTMEQSDVWRRWQVWVDFNSCNAFLLLVTSSILTVSI